MNFQQGKKASYNNQVHQLKAKHDSSKSKDPSSKSEEKTSAIGSLMYTIPNNAHPMGVGNFPTNMMTGGATVKEIEVVRNCYWCSSLKTKL